MGRRYSIGEMSNLLGVKPHVIRYWEEEIPFIAPRKDLTGRRVYTEREVQLLLRLKDLLYRDRYTIEGARERIWLDLNPSEPELLGRVAAIRRELLDIWLRVRERRG
jgi:DNA-binding transcriptional MerR regulator